MQLDPKELSISSYPETPKFGMHVGMPNGVRVTHIPTGATAVCDTERSQHKNREQALKDLAFVLSLQQDAVATEVVAPKQSAADIDEQGVDDFAVVMKYKMMTSRLKGRGGWDNPDQCSEEYLAQLLVEHVEKGDVADIANFCMMLFKRGYKPETLQVAMKRRLSREFTRGYEAGEFDMEKYGPNSY